MRFARWTFLIAGIYGLLVIVPMYFTEQRFNHDHPPAITHPEWYYGFAGVALAWQLMFLVIAKDPVRLRPAILPALVEKIGFPIAAYVLHAQGRIPLPVFVFAHIDLLLFVLFVIAYVKTRDLRPQPAS